GKRREEARDSEAVDPADAGPFRATCVPPDHSTGKGQLMAKELRVVKGAAARLRDGNPEPRVPCLLLLDVSGSMSGDKIQELNAGLDPLRNDFLKDEQAARRVELAVITFGGKVEVVQDYVSPAEFKPPVLGADGDTPMGAAILQGLDLVK